MHLVATALTLYPVTAACKSEEHLIHELADEFR
jgi:hypothetical protein